MTSVASGCASSHARVSAGACVSLLVRILPPETQSHFQSLNFKGERRAGRGEQLKIPVRPGSPKGTASGGSWEKPTTARGPPNAGKTDGDSLLQMRSEGPEARAHAGQRPRPSR